MSKPQKQERASWVCSTRRSVQLGPGQEGTGWGELSLPRAPSAKVHPKAEGRRES